MLRSLIHRLPLGWSVRLALLRLGSQWQSLLTIIVGVLLAAVIGANVPLYTASIAQAGMVQRLDRGPANDVNIFSRISLSALDVTDLGVTWRATDAVVRDLVRTTFDEKLPGWVEQTVAWGETAPMQVVLGGEDIEATRMRVATYEGLSESARLIEGNWPDDSIVPDTDIQVVIGLQASISLGLGVGDVLVLDQRGWDTSTPIRALITGVIAEKDPGDSYWMSPSPLRVEGAGEWAVETNALTTRQSFLRAAGAYIPQTRSLLGWRVLFDHTRLPYTEIPTAAVRLEGFQAAMQTVFFAPGGLSLNFVYYTRLPAILTGYALEVSLLGAPFGLLLLQIGGLVLFFLVATASLVRRAERRELAMLQSRGAFDRQIVLLRGVEALVIATAAAILAPFLAQRFLIWLAPVFTGLDYLPLELEQSAFFYSALASAAAFAALMATLRPVLRLPLILAGGSAARADKQPWWQKYYLDVVLLLVGGAALWRLIGVSSPLSGTQVGGLEADPLLLLAPALLFVALGSVLLRLFPGLMGVFARFFGRQAGLGGALATWQVSREPVHYGRIALLLTLAIGTGWFATSFRATVNRSQSDQARYAVGTDIRLTERNITLDADRARPPDTFLAIPGVEAASSALRFINVDVAADRQQPRAGEVLGIDSDTFGSTLYWRSDLGPVRAPRPPGQPIDLPTPGRVLPGTPARLGLWIRFDVLGFGFSKDMLYQPDLDRLLRRMSLWARVRDEAGTFIHVPFAVAEVEWTRVGADQPGLNMRSFNTTGWAYYEASLTDQEYQPQGELRLESLYWRHRARNIWGENDLRLTLADLSAIEADGTTIPLNWLASPGWDVVYDSGGLIEDTNTVGGYIPERPGADARRVRWDQFGSMTVMGLLLDYPEGAPIPAIASTTLMAMNALQPGATYQLTNVAGVRPAVRVLDSTDFYPSLYQDERPFLVVDQAALLYALNRRPSASNYSSEVWLRLGAGVPPASVMEQVDIEGDRTVIVRLTTLEGVQRDLATNPLSLGLMGLLFLAFIVALTLSVVGLITYAALTAQGRRSEFGVLRALGLSLRRLVLSLAFEQMLVILIGTLLGAALGAFLSANVVPTLAIGATGEAITPPFVVQVETVALVHYSLIMLVVLIIVLTASLLLVRRLSLAQTLRLGEE